jgi:hypothetical protein
VLFEFQKPRLLVVADIPHALIDGNVRRFMPFLAVVPLAVGGPFNHVNLVIGDSAIVKGELAITAASNSFSETNTGGFLIFPSIFDTVDDDVDATATVGEHYAKTPQHLQLLFVENELIVLELEGDHQQKTNFLQIGSHGADIVEVDELPKAGTICVARHIHNGPLIVALPTTVEIWLFSH